MFSRLLVADLQAAVVSEPSQRALNHVTEAAQTAAVLLARLTLSGACHQRGDAACLCALEICRGAVGRVSLEDSRAVTRASAGALDPRNQVEQRQSRDRVIHVCRSGPNDQRQALRIYDDVTFAPVFPPVCRVGTCVVPPKTARTDWLSMIARLRSISPWRPRRFSRRRCTSGQMPARVQSRSRRQQLTPLPQPSSFGNRFQAEPVRRMYAMPVSAARFGIAGRPPFGFGTGGGRSGSISFQNSSGTNEKAMALLPSGPPRTKFRQFSVHALGFRNSL